MAKILHFGQRKPFVTSPFPLGFVGKILQIIGAPYEMLDFSRLLQIH